MNQTTFNSRAWEIINSQTKRELKNSISDDIIDELAHDILNHSYSPEYRSVYKILSAITYRKDLSLEKISLLLRVLNRSSLFECNPPISISDAEDVTMQDVNISELSETDMADLLDFMDIPIVYKAQEVKTEKRITQNETLQKLVFKALKHHSESLAIEFITFINSTQAFDLRNLENLSPGSEFISKSSEILTKPLIAACHNLSINRVREILVTTNDPNVSDSQGTPAIFYALLACKGFENDFIEILNTFLAYQNFNKICLNSEGLNLLACAFKENRASIITALINKGFKIDDVLPGFKFPQDFSPNIFKLPREFLEAFVNILRSDFLHDRESADVNAYLDYICHAWLRPSEIYQQQLSTKAYLELLGWMKKDVTYFDKVPNFTALILSHIIESDLLTHTAVLNCLQSYPSLRANQRGKLIVQSAINSGNLFLVKELFKMGYPFAESYGTEFPSPLHTQASFTPLHHALVNNQIEIAEFLFSAGFEIDAPDGNQRTAFSYIFEKPDFLNTHAETISWMIDHEINVEQTNSDNKTLLSLAIENKNWPLIQQLINKEAYLSRDERIQLFHEALKQKRPVLIDKLLEQAQQNKDETSVQDFIKSFNHKDFFNLINIPVNFWKKNRIQYLVKEGLDLDSITDEEGNSLLASCILKNKHDIYPFLIRQNISLDPKTGASPRKLLEQRGLLDSITEKMTLKPQLLELTDHFSVKNLGHLLGDSFIYKMKNEYLNRKGVKHKITEDIEGNNPFETANFLIKILECLLIQYPQGLSPEIREKIESFITNLRLSSEIIFKIQDCLFLQNDTHLKINLTQVSKFIESKITRLEIGTCLFIPYGWTGTKSHITALEFVREETGYRVIHHNTGAGLQFHHHWTEKSKPFSYTTKHYFIPDQNLNLNFIRSLIEPTALGSTFQDHTDRAFTENDIYNLLSPYEIVLDPQSSHFQKNSLSGICSMTVFVAILKSKLGPQEGKRIEELMKGYVTGLAFQELKKFLPFQRSLSKIFHESFSNIFRKFHKQVTHSTSPENMEGKLKEISSLFKWFSSSYPTLTSKNTYSLIDKDTATQTSKMKKKLSTFEKVQSSTVTQKVDEKLLASPLPDVSNIQNIGQLQEAFDCLLANIQSAKTYKNFPLFLGNSILKLGKNLIEQLDQNTILIEELRQNPEIGLQLLNKLHDLTFWYQKNSFGDGAFGWVLCMSFAIGWIFSLQIEDRSTLTESQRLLLNYGFDSNVFLSKYTNFYDNPLLAAQWQEDFLFLSDFLKRFSPPDSTRALFNFTEHIHEENEGKDHFFILNKNQGDWRYCLEFLPEEASFWEPADKEFTEQRKKLPSDLIYNQEKEWKINWCYLNEGLPEHFYPLRNLAFLAAVKPANQEITKEKKPIFNIRGPVLKIHPNNENLLITTYQWGKNLSRLISNLKNPHINPFNVPGLFSPCVGAEKNFYSKEGQFLEDLVPLPAEQNKILSKFSQKLHPLMNLLTPTLHGEKASSIHLAMTIDYFSKHLIDLKNNEGIAIFLASLNSVSSLRNALKDSPQLAKELLDLLDMSIEYIAQNDRKDKYLLAAFNYLLEHKLRTLQYRKILNISNIDAQNQIEELREQVKNLFSFDLDKLSEEKFRFKKWYNYLHLLLISLESYQTETDSPLTPEKIKEIILLKNAVNIIENYNPDFISELILLGFYHSAITTPIKHQAAIRVFLNDYPEQRNEILNTFLKREGINLPPLDWTENPFPIFKAEFNETIYEADVLTGEIFHNHQESLSIHETIASDDYEFCISSPNIKWIRKGDYLEGEDELGKLKIYPERCKNDKIVFNKIYREIFGQRYRYIHLSEQEHFTLPYFHRKTTVHTENMESNSIWINTEKEPTDYLVINHEYNRIEAKLDSEGYFWLPYGNDFVRYEWVDINKEHYSGIYRFDPNAIFWKPAPISEKDDDYPPLLFCPSNNDVSENHLTFEFKDNKWIWRAFPHLHIAEEQKIDSIPFSHKFLILENALGIKEVLISNLGKCERIKIKNGKPFSLSPVKNIFLAETVLKNAASLEDYENGLKHLKAAFKFEAYTDYERGQLERIIRLPETKGDYSGNMLSLALYGGWLLLDNYMRNPHSKSRLMVTTISPEIVKGNVLTLIQHYLSRKSYVPPHIRIENLLNSKELDILDPFKAYYNRSTALLPPDNLDKAFKTCTISSYNIFQIESDSLSKSRCSFLTRPGKEFAENFYWLFTKALTNDRDGHKELNQLIHAMAYDSYGSNQALRVILHAATIFGSNARHSAYQEAKEIVQETIEIFSQIRCKKVSLGSPPKRLNELIEQFTQKCNSLLPPHQPTQIKFKKPAHAPQNIASSSESEKMKFGVNKQIYDELHSLCEKFFEPINEAEEEEFIPFTFTTSNKFEVDNLQTLNHDYEKGIEKNRQTVTYRLKDNYMNPLEKLEEKLKELQTEQNRFLEILRTNMLQLAQMPPTDLAAKIKHEASIMAGKKTTLTIEDCILLFLKADIKEFEKNTTLNPSEIEQLYHWTGFYLLQARKVDHINRLYAHLERLLKNSYNDSENPLLIQKIANGLKTQSHFDPNLDPNEVLIMEYIFQLYLTKDQIDTGRLVRDTIKKKSIIFQKIQASGKTLIYGHLLAKIKADGKHLSMHVCPSAQFGTGLYDMNHNTKNLFGQMANAFIFDDCPEMFTTEHLNNIKKMFKRTIREKKYINTTIESLEALGCKYDNIMLELASQEEPDDELKTKAEILKQILKIIREKAIFTLDEVHLALFPFKELRMPFGPTHPLSQSEAQLISTLLMIAESAQQDGHKLLDLRNNKQAQQTEEQYQSMLQIVTDQFLQHPLAIQELKMFTQQISEEQIDALRSFLLNTTTDIPPFIENLTTQAVEIISNPKVFPKKDLYTALSIKKAADFFVLASKLLGGRWLKKQFTHYVNEHFGLPLKPKKLPVAVPYISNMKPDNESQFSDPYVMMINTFISYAVQGIGFGHQKEQKRSKIPKLIEKLRKKAEVELRENSETYVNEIQNTPTALQFREITGLELSTLNENGKETQLLIRNKLKAHKDGLKLIFDYVNEDILTQVELYKHQTSYNGQNVAQMPKALIGYSASLDNLNMIPPNVHVETDLGTNGQTIDIWISKNPRVWISNGIDSLFEDIIAQHPEKDKIRSIIDVSCMFRGQSNTKVAEAICQYLKKSSSEIMGVLFFKEKSGKLLFMHKDYPEKPFAISGTSPEIIELETGYTPDKRFTYYDQEHCTGLDILQAFDTHAIITWREDIKLPEELQGARRLRDLNNSQRLISVVDRGSLDMIAKTLNSPEIANLEVGLADIKTLNAKHLILLGHLNRVSFQYDEENLLYCTQKIFATIQQTIRDLAYTKSIEEGIQLYKKAAYLFDKDITVDLFQKFAHAPKNVEITTYLQNLCIQLVQPIYKELTEEIYNTLLETVGKIILTSLPTLKSTISIPNNYLDSTATVVQQQAVQSSEKIGQDNIDLNHELALTQMIMSNKMTCAEEIPFSEQELANPRFLNDCSFPVPNVREAQIWNLNDTLVTQRIPHKLHSDLYVTSNFAITWNNRIDVVGRFSKIPYQWLLVYENEKWRLLFCSIQDAVNFKQQLDDKLDLKGRAMFLLRATADPKILASKSDYPITSEELNNIPEVKQLITAALFFGGNLNELNQKKSIENLDRLLDTNAREIYRHFFEDTLLRERSFYTNSSLYKFFNPNSGLNPVPQSKTNLKEKEKEKVKED